MFPAYGCLMALQQAMCHGERYVQSGGRKKIMEIFAPLLHSKT